MNNHGPLRRPGLPGYMRDLPNPPAAPPAPPPIAPPLAGPVPVADPIGLELNSQTFVFPMDQTGRELPVWATSRRWKAIDVYVQANPSAAAFHGLLSIFVYAVTGGTRALVASGRLSLTDSANFGAPFRLGAWVTGARSETTQYEVTYQFTDPAQVALVPQVGAFQVSCVASDRADPVPAGVGELVTAPASDVGLLGAFQSFPGRLELIAVGASNGAAAARWLHVHDRLAPVAAAGLLGLTPRVSLPLGAVAGAGLYTRDLRYRARGALMLVVSSTMLTTTVAVDGQISPVFR